MSNTATQTKAPPSATFTEFNVRQDGGKPHFIRLHDGVVKRLEQHLRVRAEEAAGILFGSMDSGENCTIAVEDFEPAARIEESVRKAGGARQVVGYYRSHSASDFAPEATDRALFASCFPKETRLALLLKAPKSGIGTGMFFLGEKGQLTTGRATVEFPFNLRELGAEDTAAAAPVAASASAPVGKPARGGSFLKIAIAGAVIVASVVGLNALGVFERQQPKPAVVERPAAPAPIIAPMQKSEAVVETPAVPPAPKQLVKAPEIRRAPQPSAPLPQPVAVQPAAPPPAPESRPAVNTAATPTREQNSQPAPVIPAVVVPSPKAPEPYTAPRATRQFAPVVKDSVRRLIAGEVVVRLRVNVDVAGRVTGAESLSKGNPVAEALAASVAASVKRWEFEPARRGEQKIPGDVELTFTFRK